MCIVGLYFVFLLLEDLIIGYYTSTFGNTTNLIRDQSSDGIDQAIYKFFSQDTTSHKKIVKRSIGNQLHQSNISSTVNPNKKLQEQITQKQYEIINMLWRKTQKVVHEKSTQNAITAMLYTIKIKKNIKEIKPITIFASATPLQTTTRSKIEFYYLDELPIHDKRKEAESSSKKPFLIFHLKGPYHNNSARDSNNSQLLDQKPRISAVRLNEVQNFRQIVTAASINISNKITMLPYQRTRKQYYFDYSASFKPTIKPLVTSKEINYKLNTLSTTEQSINESTTIYDKIKFFEIHDQFTRTLCTKRKTSIADSDEENLIDRNQKTLLEHLDSDQGSHDHLQAKHAKKHITDKFNQENDVADRSLNSKFLIKNETQESQTNKTLYFRNETTKSEPTNRTFLSYTIETARWSEHSFTAVYIYEPLQVHCDAAAINTHWLVAAGSCLSRVSKKSYEFFEAYDSGQSAFITYCGESWWEPERVAYVKYTVVHPSYHPKDKIRQHLYNIGAIQVVNSLTSACAGLTPVPLISHQVAATNEGSWASAVGWGLDRFHTRYGTTDLPKIPLAVYKSVVYFDSCPGNHEYRKAKTLEEGGGVRNVHCLSLPPYYGEKSDPVHGGLLLVGGKLIALYLQEERRPWGAQSAQYTAVWRLMPWLTDIAREPEEIDSVMIEV